MCRTTRSRRWRPSSSAWAATASRRGSSSRASGRGGGRKPRPGAGFVEPVIGAGGVHQPRPGYVEGVADLCARHGALYVIDAVIAGFGRLGSWFGAERFGVQPDMICFAKGVTSGYLPLGGVVVSGRVAEPFWERAGTWFRHGPTYAGHPTCCAAALANLDILEREGLIERGRELERVLADALRPLTRHDLVDEVRAGTGALGAVAFSPEAQAAAPDLVFRVFGACLQRGVIVRPLGDAVALSPPLVIADDEVQLAAQAIAQALEAVAPTVDAGGRQPEPAARP